MKITTSLVRTNSKRLIAAFMAIAIGLTASVAISASSGGTPPDPAWVGEDGIVDVEKMPERLKVVDSEGRTVGTVDRNGYLEHPQSLRVIGPDGQIVGELRREGFRPLP